MRRLIVWFLLGAQVAWATPQAEAGRLTSQAETLVSSGHWADALPLLDRATQADPSYAQAWALKGAALGVLKRFGEADTCAVRLIDLKPQSPDGWMLKGEITMSRDDPGAAVVDFQKASSIAPGDARTWVALGGAHLALNQAGPAADDFKKATTLSPEYDFAWYNLGVARHHQHQLPVALHCLDEAAFLNSKDAEIYLERGLVLDELQRTTAAREDLRRAIKLDPQQRTHIPAAVQTRLQL